MKLWIEIISLIIFGYLCYLYGKQKEREKNVRLLKGKTDEQKLDIIYNEYEDTI